MPNIKSQKDRVVQAVAEQAHNKAIKTNLKTGGRFPVRFHGHSSFDKI